MKHLIKPNCMRTVKLDEKDQRKDLDPYVLQREMEVDHDGKLWPCCVWIQGWKTKSAGTNPDEKLAKLLKDDPNFNDLTKNTWDEILEHPIYKSYINYEGWESDNPSPICIKECGVKGKSFNDQVYKSNKIEEE